MDVCSFTNSPVEEDAEPLTVPSLFSGSSWYGPGSPLPSTQMDHKELDLSPYDGFQPRPKASNPDDLPETLLGSLPPTAASPRSRKPSLPRISDPWSDYIPDGRAEQLS